MHIVIIGGGKVGASIASQLASEEHDIVLIDNNRRIVKDLSETLDMLTLYGNGADLAVMRQANVGSADLLIAATAQDEVNMICCMIAKKLGCKNAIARVRNPEYSRQMYFIKDELGLSMSVNPEWSAAREIFKLMQYPGFLKRDTFAKGRVEIVELDVGKDGPLDGVLLHDLMQKLKIRILVCAIRRGSEVTIPGGNFRLQANDKIYVTAPADQIVELLSFLGLRQKRAKNVMIIGGSRITVYLTEYLLKLGTSVRIIERDREKCKALADLFPKAIILNDDGTNQHVLDSENIWSMDSVVSLTDMDEENLVISMYAKHMNVPQVITKLNRVEYIELFKDSNIDSVVSPKTLCTQEIVRYVRAMQNTKGNSVISLHHMIDGKVDAIELNVTDKTKFCGIPIKDLKFKPNILLASINRLNQVIIPCGNDVLEPGDTVVVVCQSGRIILDLNDIFQGN